MTTHEYSNEQSYSWSEAVKIVSCSPSTLRRRLNHEGSKLGATKLRHGWIIPHTTLEAMGLLDVVNSSESVHMTTHEHSNEHYEYKQKISALEHENTRLQIENATLRAENDGLKQVLTEREKVVALLEQRPTKKEHFWNRWRHHDEAD